jgi:hypothetical protein
MGSMTFTANETAFGRTINAISKTVGSCVPASWNDRLGLRRANSVAIRGKADRRHGF